MTLHAAKGLEFPVVFIVALEEGLLPHTRANETTSELEEERRLLFVGITRARRELYLSRCRIRTFRGQQQATIPVAVPGGAARRADGVPRPLGHRAAGAAAGRQSRARGRGRPTPTREPQATPARIPPDDGGRAGGLSGGRGASPAGRHGRTWTRSARASP